MCTMPVLAAAGARLALAQTTAFCCMLLLLHIDMLGAEAQH